MSDLTALIDQIDQDVDLLRSEKAERLHAALFEDVGLLREFWGRFGSTLALRPFSSDLQKPRHAVRAATRTPQLRASWRDEFRDNPTRLLTLELPVGGVMKPVGELTPRDIQAIEEAYRTLSDTAIARAERWGRVRRMLKADDTVATAIEAGRLAVDDLMSMSPPPVSMQEAG